MKKEFTIERKIEAWKDAMDREDRWSFLYSGSMSGQWPKNRDEMLALLKAEGRALGWIISWEQKIFPSPYDGSIFPRLLTWSDGPKEDKALVLAAVTSYGPALSAASSTLQGDFIVVQAALKQDWEALDWVNWTDEIHSQRSKIIRIVLKHYSEMSDEEEKPKLLRKLVQKMETHEDEKSCLIQLLKQNGLLLRHFSPPHFRNFRDDFDVVKAAVHQNKLALTYASDRLQKDEGFVRILTTPPLSFFQSSKEEKQAQVVPTAFQDTGFRFSK